MSENEYWVPVLCDAAYFARLRDDYPEKAEWSDEELHDHFNEGRKYQILWDHIGDAYTDYEPLADAFLAYRQRIAALECQNRVQSDFLSSRQCGDHGGKWERGRCLQCELESQAKRIACLTEALALTRTVIVVACGDKAPYVRVALERIDRALSGSATKEIA